MKKLSLLVIAILPVLTFAESKISSDAVKNVAGTEPEVTNTEELVDSAINLQEVTVRANFSDERKTPLNLTTISPKDLRLHATAPNYVEVMQGVPGVYATSSTGNYGDASLNIRGFKQENIAILLNGIPIQGLTSGSMYWSNWMGLADATYAIQIQKGMGASMLSDCAMGGMVNIITRTAAINPSIDFGLSTTEYGTTKGTLNYSSGQLSHGWSFNAALSYTKGSGYVQCSDIETLSYMLSLSKQLNDRNTLVFTALGSPEKHDQRNTELSSAEVETYGRDYSKNWGMLRGKATSIGHNHYAKPYFTLQHLLTGDRFSMKNSVYLAIASGGGTSTYGQRGAASIISHQTKDGHIDFDAVMAENKAAGASQNILIDYLSGHKQAGAIVSGDYKFNDAWKLSAGVQYQYYDTWSEMKVLDLLGGESWYDSTSKQNVGIGDYTGARYGRTTHHASAFAETHYSTDRWNLNFGATVFNGNYRRHNDITGEKSQWASGVGATLKAGALYNINKVHAAYVNVGYNSRLPYAGTFLASSDLSITNDVTNEKNFMAELGWRAAWNGGGLDFSAYLASWRNKTLTVSVAKRANEAAEKYQINGLNALHKGLELTVHQRLTDWLTAKAYAMTASWLWKSGGDAVFYDTYSGETLNKTSIYCDGLHVGDAPQSQLGAQLDGRLMKGFYANIAWQFNARMYSDFDPSTRTTDDKTDAYQLPSYHLLDATIGWEGAISRDIRLNLFVTAKNLLDATYIERGTDGAKHDLASFRGYWGNARTVSFGFRMTL